MTILLVDDHDVVLRGLEAIVREAAGPRASILTASSGGEALALAAEQPADVCLIDFELPDMDGLALVARLRSVCPKARYIINTIHDELWYVRQFMDAGVDGILFKSVDAGEIAAAVCDVAAGRRHYCPEARAVALEAEDTIAPSSRELDVLRHTARGLSTKETAARMCISENTVETHRRHLLDKLHARNVAELVSIACKKGML